MIKCFPNSLAIFADFVNRRGLRLPPVRAISCTGENLYPHQRQLFADTFGGEVFEKYGTKETGVMACECSMHRGLHTFTEGSYVEILGADGKPAQAGEMGRLVVTDLFNYGMPMIRYEIGDMAVVAARDACGCGSPLPLIDRIVGRDRDILYDGDGNPKPGYLFVETVNALGLTAQFQIIQTARDSVLMKVIPNGAEAGDIETARLRIAGILGPRVHVRTELTNQLPRDPSGKYRYVVSQLRPSEQPPSQPAQLQLP
jgi:phenylacetate-CoA ligase